MMMRLLEVSYCFWSFCSVRAVPDAVTLEEVLFSAGMEQDSGLWYGLRWPQGGAQEEV